jgi:hypothetical protein
MTDADLARAINESGFPLQLGLKQLAQSCPEWHVALWEHPWRDPIGDDERFIDLVLRGRGDGPQRLVIECKRSRETELLFLREPTSYHDRDGRLNVRARAVVKRPRGGTEVNEWLDVPFIPGSPEANYCVIRKNNQRTQELLEKTAAEVARAADALAEQETAIYAGNRLRVGSDQPLTRVYIPVIVTTAKMYICDAEYEKVDPQTGEVPSASATDVPVVRFMKSLGLPDPTRSSATSIEQFAQQSERSVVVIQAAYFTKCLNNWDLSRRMPPGLLDALFG